MCRLFAYASPREKAVNGLLDDHEFLSFRSLSALHRDGWGMAWLTTDVDDRADRVETVRSPICALDDEPFNEFASAALGRAGLVHLRWATQGLSVCPENTHPFLADGMAFAHNGSIPDSQKILELLSDESKQHVQGDTDSERFFLLVRQRIAESGDVLTAIRRAVQDVRSISSLASLNFVLLSENMLVALQGQGETPAPVESLRAAVTSPEDLPLGHDEDYYRLRYLQRDDCFMIASTGITNERWKALDEDSIIVVDLREYVVTISPLSDAGSVETFSLDAVRSGSDIAEVR